MPHERTPLIQHVPVADHWDRYPNTSLRRFCTVALIAIPLTTVAVVLISVLLSGQSDLFGDHQTSPAGHEFYRQAGSLSIPHSSWPESDGLPYDKLKQLLLDTPSPEKAKEWSRYYSAGPHLAGKNLSQAEWTRDRWQEFGVEQSEVVAYDVYINYPLDHRLALYNGSKVAYECVLEEDVLDDDPTTGLPDRIPTFHGYSASGNVTAQYVYVNYGTYQDFEDLQAVNVSLEGKIALIKYGGIFRGLKVKRASELGMIGAVIYSDPGDDGEVTEENGLKTYPDGPARNPSSVQRGSVQYLSVAPGDPTTPGYPSKPGAPRQPVNSAIPDIPSIPISYADALPLLIALNGIGPDASSFPSHWHGGGLGYKGVQYNIGPSPPDLMLNLVNEQEYVTNPLWNVIGIINGSIADEVVVLGNHRDAWIAGGAADPNSGSAALNEVIRSFGEALKAGWKPLRTIVFASWDGEEYGLVGSTEWVEEYVPWLSHSTIAYLNVDGGAGGPQFDASASPLLNKALIETTKAVQSPNQTSEGSTVHDLWDEHIATIGSGSDYTAFQDFAGIPCVDLGFDVGPTDPVYHYHSNYDSFVWMDTLGDAGWEYHATISRLWALLAAKLIEEPVVRLNATDYAVGLSKYLDRVKDLAAETSSSIDDAEALKTPCARLEKAIAKLLAVSTHFDAAAANLAIQAANTYAMPTTPSALVRLYGQVRAVNTRYKYLERQFLFAPGLDSRSWFKHVVFAPGLWTGYAGATFPGLVEAIEAGDRAAVERWTGIIEDRIYSAVDLLGY